VKTPRALVISPVPFKFATRSRKTALAFRLGCSTTYVSLSRAGRTKSWDEHGASSQDGIQVIQVKTRAPLTGPRRSNQIRNLLLSYLPAVTQLTWKVLRTPAAVVVVNNTTLLPVGLLHRFLHRSRVVADINERPGMIQSKGSLASWFSRGEVPMLRFASRFVDAAMVVTTADVEAVSGMGFDRVHLVRNVPMLSWRAPYTPPPIAASPKSPVRAIAMGTVYEGRGYEALLRAVASASKQTRIHLTICGPGRDDYLASLKALAAAEGIEDRVDFLERISPDDVSAQYLNHDIGLVLYEGSDPANDGLSNKLFECVCSGRPVIASDLPENRKFLTESNVGWLADTTVPALAHALVTAARDPQEIVRRARHCRNFADSQLNWETEVAPLLGEVMDRH
jgi:glycosyltransferase involved in cell wall biosynthesis